MKKQTFAIAVAFLFSIQTKAQNTIQPNNVQQVNIPSKTVVVQQPNATAHILNISAVTLSIDSSVHVTNGAGAVKHYLKATINYAGPGIIQYRWVTVSLANSPNPMPPYYGNGTLQLSGTGTDEIFTERDQVTGNAGKRVLLQILSPVRIDSNTLTF
jgi:hypothetical protein